MCGAPKQGGSLAGIDLNTQTVIQGSVWHEGAPVPGAYVRLLDATDEFTAEVVTSPEGEFRFFLLLPGILNPLLLLLREQLMAIFRILVTAPCKSPAGMPGIREGMYAARGAARPQAGHGAATTA